MAEKIVPGKYTAKISNYGITPTKSGDPQIAVLFDFNDQDGTPHEITWFGSLNGEKAQEITSKACLTMGLVGNDLGKIAAGVEGGALDHETPVSIQIEPHTWDGKTVMRVKFINRLGGQAFQKKLSESEAKLKLAALNLGGVVAAARQELGIKDERKAKPAGAARASVLLLRARVG